MTEKKRDRIVQVLMNGYRYQAAELAGVITISRDGGVIGKAKWKDDQLLECSAVLPDDVTEALEKKIKEMVDAYYFD
jgi:hypothetical protein